MPKTENQVDKARERIAKLREESTEVRQDTAASIREQEEALNMARLEAEEERLRAKVAADKRMAQAATKGASREQLEQVREGQRAVNPPPAVEEEK